LAVGGVREGEQQVAEQRAFLEGFQGGHAAAALALPGPVVAVGEAETGALRKEA